MIETIIGYVICGLFGFYLGLKARREPRDKNDWVRWEE